MDLALKRIVRKWTLDNARKYAGKAELGAVIAKVLGERPELKAQLKTLVPDIKKIIAEVNMLGVEKQVEELKGLAPELLEAKKEEKKELPELKNAVKGKVVTRIPPEPSKYSHIGHALSFLINYLYAKRYNGKCVLRFEDTNPERSTHEFLHAIEEDIAWLGITPDKVVVTSNDMPKFYKYAEQLIKAGHAYACFCERAKMKELRFKGVGCKCRTHTVEQNMASWEKMLNKEFREEEVCLRLKGDMKSPNGTMRDPVLLRLCYTPHYAHKEAYAVWPMYDFANAIEDYLCGVTHICRSAEFAQRGELQNYIKDLLKLKKQEVLEYGRFNVIGAITKGREIRHLIEDGKMLGWDDPRLVTIKALRRRGIVPETFKALVYELGLKPGEANIDWAIIAAINRKILDPKTKRYFFVSNPEKITVEGAPSRSVEIKLHPDHPEFGKRTFKTADTFYIDENDFKKLKPGKLYRLMECCNFIKKGKKFLFDSTEVETYREKGKGIMHWLPTQAKPVNVEVLMPDTAILKGLAEPSVLELKEGEIIQFERFGFCRLDKKEKDKLTFWFTHK